MARFDIYRNPYPVERGHTPYVLDVQNDHLSGLATRVVVPLRTEDFYRRTAHDLNPLIEVQGQQLVMDTASLAPVQARVLARAVTQVGAQRPAVLAALDTLFGAY
ncbi:MAG TPA: CcdB family protein [Aquabacterium sp.]|nr:CcdB family protein [Aquabacterium sp.]HQC94887.1 CcdB family protein [Aquabacterium sp.]